MGADGEGKRMIESRKIMRLIESFDDAIDDFEEVVAHHAAQARAPSESGASLLSVLEVSTTVCLPIGEEIDASLCLACDHFVGCHRDGSGELVVDCWTHQRRPRLARGTQSLAVPLNFD
jgi:hypothetical protein